MSHGDDPFVPVLRALAVDPSTPFGTPGARVETLRTIEGLFSSVRRVKVVTASGTTLAYIKILKPRAAGHEELARIDRMLAREYRATRALSEALQQTDGLGALRPLAVLPEHRAMVTEEVPGRTWIEILEERSRLTDDLTVTAERIGTWVRVYQRIGEAAGAVELSERRSYLDARLQLLLRRVVSSEERQRMLSRFDALAAEIGAPTVPAVAIHADLAPTNVIVTPEGRVTVLDFTMAKSGTKYHDLGHVYFHLEMMAVRHPAKRTMFEGLQRALLRGYDPALSAAHPLFRMMLMQHGVCHVALLAERRIPVLDVAYRWFLKRRWAICERMTADTGALRVT